VEAGETHVVYAIVSPSILGGLLTVVKFVEYDQRAHRLNPLATFSFWVSSKVFYQSYRHYNTDVCVIR
jgi:hypothetical protein